MLSRTESFDRVGPASGRGVSRLRLVGNFAFLAGGEVVGKCLTMAAYVYLARVLGPTDFGTLEFALAVITVLALVVDCGLGPYGACAVGKDPGMIAALLRPIVTTRLALVVVAWVVLAGSVLLLDQPWSARRILLLYGLALLPLPASLSWVFQGTDAMSVVAAGSMVRWTVFAAGVGLLVAGPLDTAAVPLIETIACASMVVFYLAAFRWRFRLAARPEGGPGSVTVFRRALPIGASELAWALRMYSATVLLGVFAGGAEVGWFGGVHRIMLALHTFVWLYFFNVLPSIARTSMRPLTELAVFLRGSLRLTAWSVVFLGIVGGALADPIVTTLYGPAFRPAGSVLPVLIWVVSLAAMSGHYRYVLIGHGQQRLEFMAALCGAVVSIVLGAALAPSTGMLGVAAALVAAEAAVWAVAWVFVRQRVMPIPVWPVLWKPLLGGVGLASALALSPPEAPWPVLIVAAVGYWLCAVALEPRWRHGVRAQLAKPSGPRSVNP
jgi:O-antigen/teichoic acid export membrane protein